MPAAKKPTTRKPTAKSATGRPSRSAATRRDVERHIARFEKHLDDAGDVLQLLGKDMGRGTQDAYKELTKAMKALRRDAAKTNRNLLKDFDKLRAAVTPGGRTRRSGSAARRTTGSGRSK